MCVCQGGEWSAMRNKDICGAFLQRQGCSDRRDHDKCHSLPHVWERLRGQGLQRWLSFIIRCSTCSQAFVALDFPHWDKAAAEGDTVEEQTQQQQEPKQSK